MSNKGITAKILLCIRDNPGIHAAEVVRRVLPGIESTTEDGKKMLHNIINQLKNRDRILFEKRGRGLFVTYKEKQGVGVLPSAARAIERGEE